MQTFLPYSDFTASAKVLDNKRLNKQIVEAYQIYTGRVPQKNHPACLMWEGYKAYLILYIYAMCKEYKKRFDKTHSVMRELFTDESFFAVFDVAVAKCALPYHLTDPLIQISHCVNLIRKDSRHYGHKLRSRLYGLSQMMYGRYVELDEYPVGYYWPVEPVGKKARQDRENWLNFK